MSVVVASSCDSLAQARIKSSHWLFGPWLDSFFIANLAWPLLLLLQQSDGFEGRAGLQFWQIYFVTTPHRWITLAIVFLDRRRYADLGWTIAGWFVAVVLTCSAVRWTTGTLTCLLTIDYLWNAWHFAAQHHGIYRIYGRLNGPARGWSVVTERWMMRGFLLYVALRVAVATWSDDDVKPWLDNIDWLLSSLPLLLIARDILRISRIALGQMVYLASVSMLYLALLGAVHWQQPALVVSLTTASAMFHALEYLSIVSWSVRRRAKSDGRAMGWLHNIAGIWFVGLTAFMVILGTSAWLIDHQWTEAWLFLNVVAAFLHYAYDGLIWKQRSSTVMARPAPVAGQVRLVTAQRGHCAS